METLIVFFKILFTGVVVNLLNPYARKMLLRFFFCVLHLTEDRNGESIYARQAGREEKEGRGRDKPNL